MENAFIEAPLDAIANVVRKSELVRNLVENRWLSLFAIDDDGVVRNI